ncbi:MAG: hypothetical protein DWQ19_08875 [Crenarchaeota archaeon]|nr:MAG: hypothetical protein DWQ19_08875 [Thermoproteota archaeon]
MASERDFYRTILIVEVLSEDFPYDYCGLNQLSYDASNEYSVSVDVQESKKVSPQLMAHLLEEQGSDPEFFRLNEHGEDISEVEESQFEREAQVERLWNWVSPELKSYSNLIEGLLDVLTTDQLINFVNDRVEHDEDED